MVVRRGVPVGTLVHVAQRHIVRVAAELRAEVGDHASAGGFLGSGACAIGAARAVQILSDCLATADERSVEPRDALCAAGLVEAAVHLLAVAEVVSPLVARGVEAGAAADARPRGRARIGALRLLPTSPSAMDLRETASA